MTIDHDNNNDYDDHDYDDVINIYASQIKSSAEQREWGEERAENRFQRSSKAHHSLIMIMIIIIIIISFAHHDQHHHQHIHYHLHQLIDLFIKILEINYSSWST